MTRKVIAWEGEIKLPDTLIERGALMWEEPLPITANDYKVLGFADDLRREEDGSITADLHITAHRDAIGLVDEHSSFSVFVNQIVEKQPVGVDLSFRLVAFARIREVHLIEEPQTVPW